jgi:hypothetical protein
VREVDENTLIITNGFSCSSQIDQQTGKEALHLAEVIKLAIDKSRGKVVQRARVKERVKKSS